MNNLVECGPKCQLMIVGWGVAASIPAVGVQLSGASFHTRRRARAALSQCVPGRGAAVPIPVTGGLDEPNRSAGGDGSSHATVRRGTHLPLSRYVQPHHQTNFYYTSNGPYHRHPT